MELVKGTILEWQRNDIRNYWLTVQIFPRVWVHLPLGQPQEKLLRKILCWSSASCFRLSKASSENEWFPIDSHRPFYKASDLLGDQFAVSSQTDKIGRGKIFFVCALLLFFSIYFFPIDKWELKGAKVIGSIDKRPQIPAILTACCSKSLSHWCRNRDMFTWYKMDVC